VKGYDKRTHGLYKVETEKDKMISLCSKMYCCADTTEKDLNYDAKASKKMVTMLIIEIPCMI
jgi:hypothetical protein